MYCMTETVGGKENYSTLTICDEINRMGRRYTQMNADKFIIIFYHGWTRMNTDKCLPQLKQVGWVERRESQQHNTGNVLG